MEPKKEVKLDAPIPGMSLTAEPKTRPWRRPYRFSSIDEVASYYMDNMLNAEFVAGLTEQVETGFTLAFIADTLITASTMDGVHSIDLGVLVSPVIIATMKSLLDADKVEYKIGDEQDKIPMSEKKLMQLRDKLLTEDTDELSDSPPLEEEIDKEDMESSEEIPIETITGLMSRK